MFYSVIFVCNLQIIMESIGEGLLSQGLSSEVVGLLILNELKCFRKELTNEVKNLSRKLDSVSQNCLFKDKISCNDVTGDNANVSIDLPAATSCFNSIFKNLNTNSSVFSQSETFKEISPQRHNEILNNHIAFRINEPSRTNQITDTVDLGSINKDVVMFNRNTESIDSPSTLNVTSVSSQIEKPNLKHINPLPTKQTADSSNSKSKYSVIYKCTFCTAQYDIMSQYNEHYTEVHSGDFSSNSMSTKSFLEDQTMRNLYDIPLPKIVYICSICSRHFSSKGGVIRHNVLHSGVKKYVCKLCGKGFFRSDHLKSHLPTHSRRKQYQCSVCSKYFSGLDNFQTHMQLHEMETESQSGISDQQANASEFRDANASSSIYNTSLQNAGHCMNVSTFQDDYCIKKEVIHDSN